MPSVNNSNSFLLFLIHKSPGQYTKGTEQEQATADQIVTLGEFI